MEQDDKHYQTYLQILKEELVPAMGCTEPIAIASGSARAREVLGVIPDKVVAEVSSNIVKNAKSVVVPNTAGLKGMEASLPVIEYARELKVTAEKLYRGLVLSNLLTLHLKTGIGRLSAFCGVVCAGCSSGASIAYLHGGGYDEIIHALVNAAAIVSGIICDGAKSSCAAKIAVAVDAGIMGYQMYKDGQQFPREDGIIANGVEETISNIGYLARVGMKETDKEIINIMLNKYESNCY